MTPPFHVTVFGGSQPKPGDPAYRQALRLGRLLAEAGYAVLTGGYIGTMEAVSRGAAQAGGHVIGVTCDEIESWRPVAPNHWVQEERRFATLRQRLYALIDSCDAALALPGGVGTLAEIAAMWSQIQTRAISPRPLILIGPEWKATFDQFFENLGMYVIAADRDRLAFAPDVDAASSLLQTSLPASPIPPDRPHHP